MPTFKATNVPSTVAGLDTLGEAQKASNKSKFVQNLIGTKDVALQVGTNVNNTLIQQKQELLREKNIQDTIQSSIDFKQFQDESKDLSSQDKIQKINETMLFLDNDEISDSYKRGMQTQLLKYMDVAEKQRIQEATEINSNILKTQLEIESSQQTLTSDYIAERIEDIHNLDTSVDRGALRNASITGISQNYTNSMYDIDTKDTNSIKEINDISNAYKLQLKELSQDVRFMGTNSAKAKKEMESIIKEVDSLKKNKINESIDFAKESIEIAKGIDTSDVNAYIVPPESLKSRFNTAYANKTKIEKERAFLEYSKNYNERSKGRAFDFGKFVDDGFLTDEQKKNKFIMGNAVKNSQMLHESALANMNIVQLSKLNKITNEDKIATSLKGSTDRYVNSIPDEETLGNFYNFAVSSMKNPKTSNVMSNTISKKERENIEDGFMLREVLGITSIQARELSKKDLTGLSLTNEQNDKIQDLSNNLLPHQRNSLKRMAIRIVSNGGDLDNLKDRAEEFFEQDEINDIVIDKTFGSFAEDSALSIEENRDIFVNLLKSDVKKKFGEEQDFYIQLSSSHKYGYTDNKGKQNIGTSQTYNIVDKVTGVVIDTGIIPYSAIEDERITQAESDKDSFWARAKALGLETIDISVDIGKFVFEQNIGKPVAVLSDTAQVVGENLKELLPDSLTDLKNAENNIRAFAENIKRYDNDSSIIDIVDGMGSEIFNTSIENPEKMYNYFTNKMYDEDAINNQIKREKSRYSLNNMPTNENLRETIILRTNERARILRTYLRFIDENK